MLGVGEFFDRVHSEYFGAGDSGMRDCARMASSRLHEKVSGDVLCVGGIWSQVNEQRLMEECASVTVLDVSEAMASRWRDAGFVSTVGDARELPFGYGSFDTVVFPLVLHHIAGQSGRQARKGVRRAIGEAVRVLRPGGSVLISDFTIPAAVYAAELALSRVTNAILNTAGIPLVVMHPASFYCGVLRENDVSPTELEVLRPADDRPWDMMRPIIGLPSLRIPRWTYPIQGFLLEGQLHRGF